VKSGTLNDYKEGILSRKSMFIKMLLPSKSKKKRGHFQFTKETADVLKEENKEFLN